MFRTVQATYDSDSTLKYARMLSMIYYLTPEYFDNPRKFRDAKDCIEALATHGREYLETRNAASERMQKKAILHNSFDIKEMAAAINKGGVKIHAFSVENDQLFPAAEQKEHLGVLSRHCPGLIKHRTISPSLNGHSSFLKEGFRIK